MFVSSRLLEENLCDIVLFHLLLQTLNLSREIDIASFLVQTSLQQQTCGHMYAI